MILFPSNGKTRDAANHVSDHPFLIRMNDADATRLAAAEITPSFAAFWCSLSSIPSNPKATLEVEVEKARIDVDAARARAVAVERAAVSKPRMMLSSQRL
jgi:hypothetical protein